MIDLYVELEEMPPLQRGENLISLWEELENLFERKVDLLTDQPIRNTYLKSSIDSTKQLIYDGIGEEVLA
ncbi:MAG: putative nucleotidyltransferase [Spirosomataceae bacterium]|jgi:predicted nucleotidyltransferase